MADEQSTEATTIQEVQKADVIILRAKGKLDCHISSALEKKAFEIIEAGHKKLLINLEEVSYINSSGLRMLLSIKKQMKSLPGRFIICSLRSEVLEIIKICGFDHVLEIAKSEEEGIRLFS